MNEKEFIKMIRNKRINAFMTQKQVAKRLCISISQYSKLENFRISPSFKVIQGLAEIFDLDLNIIKYNKSPNFLVTYD